MHLIALIASHIDSEKRLHFFLKLMSSINKQIDYFEKIDVRVSLSYEPTIDKQQMQFLIESANINKFEFYYQDTKYRQFEHYKFLVDSLGAYDENTTWIIFSDDDDEWSDNRLAAYHHMINYITEDTYDKTTSICYTNQKNKTNSTYIGSYVDYCVKLKYLKIFFEHATKEQLQHKFCDCYFVKYICTYGKGLLKRAFCATDETLYHWAQHAKSDPEYSPESKPLSLKDSLVNNLDLYMAQYSNQNAKDWVLFCDVYTNNKISNKEIPINIKKFIIKIYLDKFENHIFNTKNLPVYSVESDNTI